MLPGPYYQDGEQNIPAVRFAVGGSLSRPRYPLGETVQRR